MEFRYISERSEISHSGFKYNSQHPDKSRLDLRYLTQHRDTSRRMLCSTDTSRKVMYPKIGEIRIFVNFSNDKEF